MKIKITKRNIFILVFLVFIITLGLLLAKCKGDDKSDGKNNHIPNHEIEINSKEDIPINFDELKKENDEIYAWIIVPGTKVDYPILQSKEDNSFYLTNDKNKKAFAGGAIHTQFYNSTDFNDFNTLIYGHNMKNGTMFGELKKFKNKDFFEKNQDIVIYTPNRVLKYKIFAAYTYDDRHIMSEFNFSSRVDRQIYIDSLSDINDKNSLFKKGTELDTDDRIITLSTCNGNKKERFLVQAVLVNDTEF